MRKKFVVAAFAIIAILMTTVVLALIQSTKQIPSSGSVYAFKVGVFDDIGCNTETTSIAFNAVNPGGNDPHTVYVKNIGGNLDMTLNMTTANWEPINCTTLYGLTITWDQEGTALTPDDSVAAILTLNVPDNQYTQEGLAAFNVTISITGSNSTFP
jgi:hypothetical protein